MDVSEAQRLRALEDENAKRKKLLAEAMLDLAILKGEQHQPSGLGFGIQARHSESRLRERS